MTRTHLPADESQRHLLPPPEGQTPEFDGVEDHLHGKVVGEPPHEGRHDRDEEVGDGPGAELGRGGAEKGGWPERAPALLNTVVTGIVRLGGQTNAPWRRKQAAGMSPLA